MQTHRYYIWFVRQQGQCNSSSGIMNIIWHIKTYVLVPCPCGIIEDLLCTQSHKNHLLGNRSRDKGVRCWSADDRSLNPSPPSGPPPLQKPSPPLCPLPWPEWGGSVGCWSPCGASPPTCRRPAGRCWAAGGAAEAGGSGTAPSRWNVSASRESSRSPGGCDQNWQTFGGSPQQRPLQLGRAAPGGTGWRAGWRRTASEGQTRGEESWAPVAAAGNRRGWQECWPWRWWSAWVVL